MWQHCFETTTDLCPEQIWPVLANVAGWPAVDHNIERLEVMGPPGPGVKFRLKPKGGPWLEFEIGEFAAPGRYSDICRLWGAEMVTRHELLAGEQTTVRVRIEIRGWLAGFWGLAVGRKHASGLPAQTARILAAARG